MKKQLLVGVSLAAVLALGLDGFAKPRTGMYAGVQAGLAYLKTDGKYKSERAGSDTPTANVGNKTGVMANVLVGYETMATDTLIVGGEFTFGSSFSGAKKKFLDDTGPDDPRTVNIRQKWETGLHVLMGMPLSETFSLYGKLGVAYSSFELKQLNQVATSNASSPSAVRTKKLWGIKPGVRLNWDISHSLSAHFDTNYTFYQKRTEKDTLPGLAADDQTSVRYQPNKLDFAVGLRYKF